jgi:signal transduction histidine kinase/CheY-like chemotaxis protein/HAMP domain-containing protein
MIRRLTIRTRLVILASVLIFVIIGTNFYLTRKLTDNSTAVVAATELLGVVEQANNARLTFGEMRYWLADLAVSQLTLSESNAAAARDRTNRYLDSLAERKPALVATVRTELAAFEKTTLAAVDEYTNDHRVLGNTLLAQARTHGIEIDKLLASLVTELNAEAGIARDRVIADVAAARRLSVLIVVFSILAGLALTLIIIRSIATPLHRLVLAIDGLSAGDTAAAIPAPGPDEIGAMARALALFRDSLEERNRLAAESERQRQTLATAIATISEGFALYDADDRIVLCNDHFREFWPGLADLIRPGIAFRQIVEATAERGLVELGDQSAAEWVEERLRRRRTPHGFVEYNFQGRWVRISERRTPDGGVVAVFTDITELKRRQIELEQAREQSETANRAKSQFLANMSHELRTPLNAVIGYSEMLQDEAADSGQDGFIPDLKKIEDAGRHLLSLINDILDLSKIEAGKMDIYAEHVEIIPLVDEVRAIIEPLAGRNGNKLAIKCPPSIGGMQTDRTKLKQALLNLLSNGAKFTKNGRLELAIERSETAGGNTVRFAVSDTGIGMSEAQLGNLFQPFTQADASTTKKYGGTGLGLAITRHFCQMLGGDVTATSRPGAGSTFTIVLPDGVVAPVEPAGAAVPQISGEISSTITVLVVDDDSAAHDLLAAGLGREGYRLVHARNGEDALALARKIRPDAITLDVMMPKLDGWAVLTSLKADPELCTIPVVMVTILADRGIGLSLGAAEFMTKPVDRNRLAALLRLLLRRDGAVLVVEDDPSTREMTKRTLEKMDYAVAEAANGRDALRWLEQNPAPAVILLDLMMPEMDGFEFLDDFRGVQKWRDIPVIVLTAKQLTPSERERLTGRAKQILAKGEATGASLAAIVDEAVRRRPARETAVPA